MRKRLSRALSKKATSGRQKDLGLWDEAILEAQSQIAQVEREAMQRIARLTKSKRTLQALRDSGAAFPGQNKGQEIAA